MKEIHELNLPDDVRYAEDHEWAKPMEDRVRIGISDYAQEQLGDITYVELPDVDATFATGDQFGTLESTKAVADLFMPVAGEVVAVNTTLGEAPELVNQSPYDEGWLVEVKPDDPARLGELMTRDAYRVMLEGID